ncbi:MAG: hypothetical protein QM737_11115 [Ferruginibacter sp.]
MNDLTRYEKELADELKQLPLPDKEGEWDEMKKLLDKEDDTVVPPPFFFNLFIRKAGYAILLLLIIAACWFYTNNSGRKVISKEISKDESGAQHNKENQENNSNKKIIEPVTGDNSDATKNNKEIQNNNGPVSKNDQAGKPGTTITAGKTQNDESGNRKNTTINKNDIDPSLLLTTNTNDKEKTASKIIGGKEIHAGNSKRKPGKTTSKGIVKASIINPGTETDAGNDDDVETKTNSRKNKKINTRDAAATVKTTNGALAEDEKPGEIKVQTDHPNAIKQTGTSKTLVQQKQADSLSATSIAVDSPQIKSIAKSPTDSSGEKQKIKIQTSKKKQAAFAVGIAEQQAIRSDCNCEYPGSNYKNKFAIKDYIPSVNIRYYSKKKWFTQAEFKYAAPHYVREFLYEKQVKEEPFHYITKSAVLKRTYFHEFSLSFNYFVIPHLSAGIGIKYNIFSSGTIQADEKKKLYGIAADSLISSSITKQRSGIGTLNFYNTANLFFEMQYQWKRFSIGGRYSIGLQPYVKYTDPTLKSPDNKKANSFNLFLRYELLRLKKK